MITIVLYTMYSREIMTGPPTKKLGFRHSVSRLPVHFLDLQYFRSVLVGGGGGWGGRDRLKNLKTDSDYDYDSENPITDHKNDCTSAKTDCDSDL